MEPVLAVLAQTDSFVGVWQDLAARVGMALRLGESAAALAPLGEACAVVIAAGGREERAAEALVELDAAGADGVAVVGAAEDRRLALALVRAGASDYFVLPGELELLRAWVAARRERAAAARRAEELTAYERDRYDFSRIVGRSPGLLAALERAARVIPHAGATVLITGETGTGKELVAQAIHYNGPRAAAPLVEVNCTALPPTLLEGELFGYEKGAFTDARVAKPGLFEAAHGGTLFLDEVGDLSRDLQAKLLRVLAEKQVRRLGSVRSFHVDVRIIAATHVDLADAVRRGAFRQDLFYRLNVVPLHLPPLRDRGDDILALADHFLDQFSAEYAVPRPRLTSKARDALLAHPWWGNVRELRNAVERAVLLGGPTLEPRDLFFASPAPADTPTLPFPATLDAIQRAAARSMLERCGGNKSAAAGALGISRSRLYRLLDPDRDV
ncbi:MAG TPA: sigma 54-interacting transcriptional regulator [Longimicrobiales bacterium]